MADLSLNKQIKSATKWSTITEIVAKLIAPIVNMVLARLLTPEAFGVVATLTMIISFAEIFTDAGFQKYLIQHQFKDDADREQSTNVAFWSNLVMSLFIWAVIAIFCETLAVMVGNPGLGYVIVIACISIPLAAFSSIQMALYKRDFDFKTLFKVRIVGILIPLIVTIPLALYFRNFWALLCGTIAKDIVNAALLTYYSKWKPKLHYNWEKLKEMFSFSVWSMFEQVSIWLTSYMDTFIVGVFLSSYYLGLYRTSMATSAQIMSIITASTTPILFSSLSRLQNDKEKFEGVYFEFQKWVGFLVLPLGVGIYCYSNLVVSIMLGEQWMEACEFVGLFGLISALTIVMSNYCSEAFRALGKPNLSTLSQWLYIVLFIPAVFIAVKYDFETLYKVRSYIRFEGVLVNLIVMRLFIKISIREMFKNIMPELFGCSAIILCYKIINAFNGGILLEIFSAIISALFYFVVVCFFKTEREMIFSKIKLILNHIKQE